MLATALATSDDLSSSGRRPHCHHLHNHRYNEQQQLDEPNNTDEQPAAAVPADRENKSRTGGNRSVHQIQVQLQLQHKQRHQSYVYPKLQLVQIDDAWYALNQTCLQIYQQLQMCGTAQLMPVDVVPLHKVFEQAHLISFLVQSFDLLCRYFSRYLLKHPKLFRLWRSTGIDRQWRLCATLTVKIRRHWSTCSASLYPRSSFFLFHVRDAAYICLDSALSIMRYKRE